MKETETRYDHLTLRIEKSSKLIWNLKYQHSWWYPYLTQFPTNYDVLASFDEFEIQALQLDDAIWAAEKASEKARMEWESAKTVMEELMFKRHYMSFKAWIWAPASVSVSDNFTCCRL